jgi:hypothetical protein
MKASVLPQEERDELAYRHSLLKAAASGDALAQLKLKEEYHVRVYSPSERGELDEKRGSPSA